MINDKLISNKDLAHIKLLLKPLVFIPMAIDLLHHGHVRILNKASKFGTLVVGLMTDKGLFKGVTYNSLEQQVDGSHYIRMKIQPAQFINENDLPFAEGNAIKYICRHKYKGKKEDLKKAIHYIEMIMERDYEDT